MSKYNYEQKRCDYLTPPELIKKVLERISFWFGEDYKEFDCDVCCSIKNIPAKKYFINGCTDGLKAEWSDLNWCNPPYNECAKWVKKAVEEQKKGHCTVMLIPVRTETAYWHQYLLNKPNIDIIFLKKGYRFIEPETKKPMGVFKNALALVYFNA